MSRANFIREFSNLTLSVIMDFFHALQREHEPGVILEENLDVYARVPRNNGLTFNFKIKSDVPYVTVKYETHRYSRRLPAQQAEDIFTPAQWFVVQRDLRNIFSIPRSNNNRSMIFKIPMDWLREQSLDSHVFLAKYKLILEGLANAFMFRDEEYGELEMHGEWFVSLNNAVQRILSVDIYPNGNVHTEGNTDDEDEGEDEGPPRGASRITTPQRSATAADGQCPVCQMDFAAGEMVQPLSCGHVYHSDCIRPWYETSATCPLCRQLSTGGRRKRLTVSSRRKSATPRRKSRSRSTSRSRRHRVSKR